MDIRKLKYPNGNLMIEGITYGLQVRWIAQQTQTMPEDEFWPWVLKLYRNGFDEQQEESLEEQRRINPHLISPDFKMKMKFCLDNIIQFHYEEFEKRELTPIEIVP